ncbi:radical SAM protein [Ignisphaera sp. 4213-co]|uniref:Radical SAM protein n=1 Tax=Ignisphaera cupida TaxID=3050454 RepID=A0ABD4Z5W9_9CREN|nr:radical SAM protein [Ignisphaera sp. 4213-co]MDK6028701.1 radical SAM protein [Ignisphaera sp. 4213-co]
MSKAFGIGYNPVEVAKTVEKIVATEIDGEVARKYFGFASTKFYGGSATGYVTGCNLSCAYCWSWKANKTFIGSFYKPSVVAQKLTQIALSKKHVYIRLSGGEPTLVINHLLQVLDYVKAFGRSREMLFILETNGIMIGYDKLIAKKLSEYSFVIARVSVKGCSEEEFYMITGAEKSFFNLQLQAVKNLVDNGVKTIVVVMLSFCNKESFSQLIEKLTAIDTAMASNIELEYVKLYPNVLKRLCKKDLKPWIAIDPIKKEVVKLDEFNKLCRNRA